MNASLRVQVYLDHQLTADEEIRLDPSRMNFFGRAQNCGKQGLQFDFRGVSPALYKNVSKHHAMIGYNARAQEWLLIDGAFTSTIADGVIRYVWQGKTQFLKPSRNGLYYQGVRIKRHLPLRDGMQFNFALMPGFSILGIFTLQGQEVYASAIEHPTVGDTENTQASLDPISHIPSGVTFVQSPAMPTEFDSLSRSRSRWVRTVANVNNLVDDTAKSAKNWVVFMGLLLASLVLVLTIAVAASHVGPDGVVEWLELFGE